MDGKTLFILSLLVIILVIILTILIILYNSEESIPSSKFSFLPKPDYELSKDTTLDAIYNVHRQKNATMNTLISFCKAYPESYIAIYNDGGDPTIAHMLEKLISKDNIKNTIMYEYDTENLNVFFPKERKQDAIKWIKRFTRNLQKLKNRWTLILEDDVYVKRRIKTKPNASIYGGKFISKTNNLKTKDEVYLSNKMSKFIRKKREKYCSGKSSEEMCSFTLNRDSRYGSSACGGIIIDREFWLKKYDEKLISEWIYEIYEFEPIIHNDILISTIYLCFGGNVLPNPEYFEVYWDPSNWNDDKYAIIHNFKKYYV